MVSGLLDDVTRRQADGLERDLRDRVDGEVRFDAGTRGAYSTDASNFRQVPIGVVLPRTPEAAVEAVAVCREYDVPVLSRGGGTSLAGQCTNAAVMLDWSKYCHRVESVDRAGAHLHRGAGHRPGCPQRTPVGGAASASARSLRLI